MIPDDANWRGQRPFDLGVAHAGPVQADGYTAIDRWEVGSANEVVTGVLVDPWDTQDGRTALVALKDTSSGVCRLVQVQRGASALSSGFETWPDRTALVPSDAYGSTVQEEVSISDLLSGSHVGGACVVEVTMDGTRHVLLIPLLVDTAIDTISSESYRTFLPGLAYSVTRTGGGDLVLTSIEYGNNNDGDESSGD